MLSSWMFLLAALFRVLLLLMLFSWRFSDDEWFDEVDRFRDDDDDDRWNDDEYE